MVRFIADPFIYYTGGRRKSQYEEKLKFFKSLTKMCANLRENDIFVIILQHDAIKNHHKEKGKRR